MTQHNDPIRIPVDLTNPGQFFACCGLLELANRLWPGAEVTGCFSAPRFQRSLFSVSARVAFSSSDVVIIRPA
jgi:CRISPR-associated protein Csb3